MYIRFLIVHLPDLSTLVKHLLLTAGLLVAAFSSHAQVGIGTSTPKAFLNVAPGKTVLFGEDTTGLGTRFVWHASLGALRANTVTPYLLLHYPLPDVVGKYSFASGLDTKASGLASTALGYDNKSIGSYTTTIGAANIADQWGATAIGVLAEARGGNSLALGYRVKATGHRSSALGTHVSTNNQEGSFIIGDGLFSMVNNLVNNTAPDQMKMKFNGGYEFYTSNSLEIGMSLPSGGNSWSVISDSTRKENFRSADGASFLRKISQMRLGSWNYKGQNSKQHRHYGPMAQDFYAAFGKDELGTIGEEKSINQADFDGVNLIAIKALIEKVEKLEAENSKLRGENADLHKETASLKSDIDWIKKQLGGLAQK